MITTYESEEDMDDAFEDLMEREANRSYLLGLIETAEQNVESAYDYWITCKEELEDLEMQLRELEDE